MTRDEFSRLSAFYFFYFAALGAFIPYRGRYFDGQGFDSLTIGLSSAAISLVTIVAPFAWAVLADRFSVGQRILRAGVLLATLLLTAGLAQTQALPLILTLAGYSLFWSALLPQAETVTLTRTAHAGSDYNRIRLWGSVGYLLAVLAVGYAVDFAGARLMQPILLGVMALLCVSIWRMPRLQTPEHNAPRDVPLRKRLRQPLILCFLLATLLVTISHAPYYTFFDLYLRGLGYAASQSGWLITLGVLAEILMFWFARRVLARYATNMLWGSALLLSAARWLLLALWPHLLPVLLVVQLLHAISFAVIHTLAMQFLHAQFPGAQRNRAQAIYSALVYGAGGVIGNVVAGALWRDGAGGSATFLMSAAACVLAALVMMLGFRWAERR